MAMNRSKNTSVWVVLALALALGCGDTPRTSGRPSPIDASGETRGDAGPELDSGSPQEAAVGPDTSIALPDSAVPEAPLGARIVVAGASDDDLFPVTGDAPQGTRTPAGGGDTSASAGIDATAAVLELKADGSVTPIFATYWGGSDRDTAEAAAIDDAGNIYIFGDTSSPDLTTHAALQPALGGQQDCWVAKFTR
jgi:hypothetical protein